MVSMGNITSMKVKKVCADLCVNLLITNPETVSQLYFCSVVLTFWV